jgi:hypothetical protein
LVEPCEIQVLNNGTIVVLGAVRSTRLGAGEIRSLEGRYQRDYSDDVWHLLLQSNKRGFIFNEFPNVMDLVKRIQSLNPDVEVRGLWPMVPP